MTNKKISDALIKRLPRYYRCLGEWIDRGITRISSLQMSEQLGYTASQVRQDLNTFGGFGHQGYGYDAPDLQHRIAEILGLNDSHRMIVIGMGNIGRALTSYAGFQQTGFIVAAAFDENIQQETEVDGILNLPMRQLGEYLSKQAIDIAVIAVPKQNAQKIADLVIGYQIRAIWNFAPLDLVCPAHVVVENMNMSESLYTLSFRYKYLKK